MAPPTLFTELPTGAQAAYSEVYEAAQLADVRRSVASLPGSFQTKRIKGRTYWYYAYRDAFSGKVRQIYVGPDSPQVQRLKDQAADATGDSIERKAAAALAHGCASIATRHFRVIRQLADSRFFRAGGILVGSHAYVALGNLLGVRWEQATATLDIDLAIGSPNIDLALPADLEIDVPSAIAALEMGFLPSLNLDGGTSGTYVSERDPDLRLDFLTPARRGGGTVRAEHLNLSLQPLKFLDYLLEHPTQAALLSNRGAAVVNVPDPARYALHKVLVAGERPVAERAKSAKDLVQAASLLECLQATMPADALQAAWSDLAARGSNWVARFRRSMTQLAARHPRIAERFEAETVAGASA